VCLKGLKEQNGETPTEGDEDKYVLAKVIGVGVKGTQGGVEIKYILFADTIPKMPYREFHFGRYKGRWFREGLYELLFDIQVRLNQIGNQIAIGLEAASKLLLRSSDKLIIQNVSSELSGGEIIKSTDLQQVNLRMEGFDQLLNERNSLIQITRDISNSQEIVQAITPASGTPLGTTQMLNANANKLFGFLQEKLSIPISEIFEEWIIPEMVKDLSAEDVVNLTGSSEMLNRVREMVVDDWYARNLINFPPHAPEVADAIKSAEMENLKKKPQLLLSGMKDLFQDFAKYCYVDISSESSTIDEDTRNLVGVINLEADPARRSFLVEKLMKNAGIDVGELPKFQTPVQAIPPMAITGK